MTLLKGFISAPPIDPSASAKVLDKEGNPLYLNANLLHGSTNMPLIQLDGLTSQAVARTVHMVQMARILKQLASFSSYSYKMFQGLDNDSQKLTKRIEQLQTRLQTVKQLLPSVLVKLQDTESKSEFSKDKRLDWRSSQPITQLFTKETADPALLEAYNQCMPLPNLSVLDPFREDGEPSMKFYSYPQFFMEKWQALMLKENQKKKKKVVRKEGVTGEQIAVSSTQKDLQSLTISETSPATESIPKTDESRDNEETQEIDQPQFVVSDMLLSAQIEVPAVSSIPDSESISPEHFKSSEQMGAAFGDQPDSFGVQKSNADLFIANNTTSNAFDIGNSINPEIKVEKLDQNGDTGLFSSFPVDNLPDKQQDYPEFPAPDDFIPEPANVSSIPAAPPMPPPPPPPPGNYQSNAMKSKPTPEIVSEIPSLSNIPPAPPLPTGNFLHAPPPAPGFSPASIPKPPPPPGQAFPIPNAAPPPPAPATPIIPHAQRLLNIENQKQVSKASMLPESIGIVKPNADQLSKQRSTLSHVDSSDVAPREKKKDARDELMSSIKGGAFNLRKSQVQQARKSEKDKAASVKNDVASVLMRRIAMEMNDEEEENQEDGETKDDEW